MKMKLTILLSLFVIGCYPLNLHRIRRDSEPCIETSTLTTTLPTTNVDENFEAITETSIFTVNTDSTTELSLYFGEFGGERNETESELEELFLTSLIRNIVESDGDFDKILQNTIDAFDPELPKSFFDQFKARWEARFYQEHLKTRSEFENERMKKLLGISLTDDCCEKEDRKVNNRRKRETSIENSEKSEGNSKGSNSKVSKDKPLTIDLLTEEPPVSRSADRISVSAKSKRVNLKSLEREVKATNSTNEKISYPDLDSETVPSDKTNIKRQSETSNGASDDLDELEPLPPLEPLYDSDNEEDFFNSSQNDDGSGPNILMRGLSGLMTLYGQLRTGVTTIWGFFSRMYNNM